MSLIKIFDLLSLIIGFAGTLFMIKGISKLTPDIMAELSKTKIGYNPDQVKNISIQKADTMTGFILVIMAFSVQIITRVCVEGNIFCITYWQDLFILTLVVIVILVITFKLNYIYCNYQRKEIEQLLPK